MDFNNFLNWLLNLLFPTKQPTFVDSMLKLHNNYRKSIGLYEFKLDQKLVTAAQNHSNWMSKNNNLNHFEGNKGVGQRVTEAGFVWQMVGENIAKGAGDQAIFNMWLKSPGHKANIERNYTYVGFGMLDYYWTTVFAK